MQITHIKDLDPVFETMGLLGLCHNPDWKNELIKELDHYGIDGDVFFQKHFKIIEKYLKTFQKYYIAAQEESFFFQHTSSATYLLLLAVVLEKRCYLDPSKKMNANALRSFLAYAISDGNEMVSEPDPPKIPAPTDEKAMIELLDASDVSTADKWYLLDLLRKPEYWFGKLFQIIRANIPAYEKARQAVAKPLDKLLAEFEQDKNKDFQKLANVYHGQKKSVSYIALVSPLVELISDHYSYQGILSQLLYVHSNVSEYSRENLIRQIKSLSEKSKLDILCALKAKSRYNLELAETLGISPSTASHHMSDLLSCGFVSVEKRDGKVYYCLDTQNLNLFIGNLKDLLC